MPQNVTLYSEGPASAMSGDDASATLLNAIDARDADAETDLLGGGQTFLDTLSDSTSLDIRTIVPSTSGTTDDTLTISGTSGSSQLEALVIDMSDMTSGMALESTTSSSLPS